MNYLSVFWCNTSIISRVALYQASVSGLCDGTCRSVCLSVGLSVCKMYCGKTAECIRMPFGMVSGVGRGMGVLDGWWLLKGKANFGGEYGASQLRRGSSQITLGRTCYLPVREKGRVKFYRWLLSIVKLRDAPTQTGEIVVLVLGEPPQFLQDAKTAILHGQHFQLGSQLAAYYSISGRAIENLKHKC